MSEIIGKRPNAEMQPSLPYTSLLNPRESFLEARTGYSTNLGKEGKLRKESAREMKAGVPVDFSKRIRIAEN